MNIYYVLMFLIGVLILLGFFIGSVILFRKNSPLIAGFVFGLGIVFVWSFYEAVGILPSSIVFNLH